MNPLQNKWVSKRIKHSFKRKSQQTSQHRTNNVKTCKLTTGTTRTLLGQVKTTGAKSCAPEWLAFHAAHVTPVV